MALGSGNGDRGKHLERAGNPQKLNFSPLLDAMLIGDSVERTILNWKLSLDTVAESFATVTVGWPDGLHVYRTTRHWNAISGGARLDVYDTAMVPARSTDVPV
ncbi:hypothetical protein CVS30_05465 [Arthrobacter psychrolactophilus]|uniref:Uncharacterized protein n=1 Tax=Arthrobacter psychrolactophilus TaxID=92442 RepID=A0A2V5JHC5_9MICC|nr:hypothetical protein [Arthrobacter psychrolactophilus]PYI39407.1 hypothetical protein CVS30_05465 [Arthrobacter psychrolactophilus]